jgi:hypothetical protein
LGYLIAATFINQFRAEILYWMILLVAVAGKVYYLQPLAEEQAQKKKNRLNNHSKTFPPSAGSA